jgi:hypothetical protein
MEIEKATGVKQAACWCVGMDFSADLLAKVPASAQGQACICAACLSQGHLGHLSRGRSSQPGSGLGHLRSSQPGSQPGSGLPSCISKPVLIPFAHGQTSTY